MKAYSSKKNTWTLYRISGVTCDLFLPLFMVPYDKTLEQASNDLAFHYRIMYRYILWNLEYTCTWYIDPLLIADLAWGNCRLFNFYTYIVLIYFSFLRVDIKNNIYSWNTYKSINFRGNHAHWWRNGKNKTNDLLPKLAFIFYILHIVLYITIMYYGHTYVPKGMERESTTRKIQWVAMVQASSGKKMHA